MKTLPNRQEAAYWLTLAFRIPPTNPKGRNGLVLVADREAELGLLDLVQRETADLPERLQRYRGLHEQLLQADGLVSAQAFVVDRLLEGGGVLVPITSDAYPAHLAHRLGPDRAPTVLSARGHLDLLAEPGVAVSGSRAASPQSLDFAREMGRALAQAGIVVVSGLAKGIDQAALEGALEAGGRVIGVAAEGLFNTRFARHPAVEAGRLVVVSEFEPTAKWEGWRAMQRNQTIAGLSKALVIADCTKEGGTTNQFEVHRGLDMPVIVRRGAGEGALVAELARRPGAVALAWENGPVVLPPVIAGPPAPMSIRVERAADGRLRIEVDAPPDTTRDAILAALADAAWPALLAVATEPVVAVDDPQDETDRAVIAALAAAPEGGLTKAELEKSVEDRKLTTRLKRLEDSGRIEKKGKPARYRVQRSDQLPLLAARG